MNPTAAEQLLYTTIKLSTMKGGSEYGSGTAFFYNINLGNDRLSTLLVTNKHVVDGADQVVAICHVAAGNSPVPSGELLQLVINLEPGGVIMHPDPDVDICAIPISATMGEAQQAGKPIFFMAMSAESIPAEKDWANFDAIEEVIMIGCPRGIYDEANNLPIFRRGTTASALTKRYNGKDQFLVDMACFPGSSGSPVFILNRDGYLDREKNAFMMGQMRFFFLGVLFAGPLFTNTGEVVLAQPPRVEVATMMHLGFVIRATELLVIEGLIRKLVASESPSAS